jgi:hypothetical protein
VPRKKEGVPRGKEGVPREEVGVSGAERERGCAFLLEEEGVPLAFHAAFGRHITGVQGVGIYVF